MFNSLRYSANVVVIAAALTIGMVGFSSSQAALPEALQSQVSVALSTGGDAAKVQAILVIAQANPGSIGDIATAAAIIDPNLAAEIAGKLAELLPTQAEKNTLVRSVCQALGDVHEDKALEVCTQVVAAVPGSEGVLEELIRTAAGGPFGDPDPDHPNEPVGATFQNQTYDQIPFYESVIQSTVSPQTVSGFENTR